jgi:hypothetical protein
MRNLITAIVITVWGSAIILSRLLSDADTGSGAYGFGQNLALAFGFVMVGAGAWALMKYFNSRA